MAKMSVRAKAKKLLEEDPNQVISALIEEPFWLNTLAVDTAYTRMGDDTGGSVTVAFGRDGDGHVEVLSEPDPRPEEFSTFHRFRTFFGGGESSRTRNALLILAEAIRQDNSERSQQARFEKRAEDARALMTLVP